MGEKLQCKCNNTSWQVMADGIQCCGCGYHIKYRAMSWTTNLKEGTMNLYLYGLHSKMRPSPKTEPENMEKIGG